MLNVAFDVQAPQPDGSRLANKKLFLIHFWHKCLKNKNNALSEKIFMNLDIKLLTSSSIGFNFIFKHTPSTFRLFKATLLIVGEREGKKRGKISSSP